MPQRRQHRDLTATPRRSEEIDRNGARIAGPLLPLPFPAPTYELYPHRHPRFHHEPANRWLRDAMSDLVKGPMHHEPLPNTKRSRSTGAR
ncbi:hypothetical protein [Burkholderia sp. BCC0044]|uniref:hypothetical protein n=1 Tax=Burkholderia sp. BCC0044 TaxID=2676295 RepID=UPI001FC8D95C|nr:hypothetical protein [Burkholderia sp. BCC0044]